MLQSASAGFTNKLKAFCRGTGPSNNRLPVFSSILSVAYLTPLVYLRDLACLPDFSSHKKCLLNRKAPPSGHSFRRCPLQHMVYSFLKDYKKKFNLRLNCIKIFDSWTIVIAYSTVSHIRTLLMISFNSPLRKRRRGHHEPKGQQGTSAPCQ